MPDYRVNELGKISLRFRIFSNCFYWKIMQSVSYFFLQPTIITLIIVQEIQLLSTKICLHQV